MYISPLINIFYVLALALVTSCALAESVCFGTTSKGRIEGAVQLPEQGSNFFPYSNLGVSLGRTYVHKRVHAATLEAYAALVKTAPGKVFVYGESGWKAGGKFRPHRTHQNGLSVDFFVPIINTQGKSVPLPTSTLNKFGYSIDFDAKGKYKTYTIDFEAIGEHLYQLDISAKKAGAPISRVIFDPPYLPKLFATKHGKYLQSNINFMKREAWVRHDEHYHVDFSVPCRALT